MAVSAVIEMAPAVCVLNLEHREKGLFEIRIGIGLNSGVTCVDDLRSHDRRSQAVIGVTVNLGSRLEGLCKANGVESVASATTAKAGERIRPSRARSGSSQRKAERRCHLRTAAAFSDRLLWRARLMETSSSNPEDAAMDAMPSAACAITLLKCRKIPLPTVCTAGTVARCAIVGQKMGRYDSFSNKVTADGMTGTACSAWRTVAQFWAQRSKVKVKRQ